MTAVPVRPPGNGCTPQSFDRGCWPSSWPRWPDGRWLPFRRDGVSVADADGVRRGSGCAFFVAQSVCPPAPCRAVGGWVGSTAVAVPGGSRRGGTRPARGTGLVGLPGAYGGLQDLVDGVRGVADGGFQCGAGGVELVIARCNGPCQGELRDRPWHPLRGNLFPSTSPTPSSSPSPAASTAPSVPPPGHCSSAF